MKLTVTKGKFQHCNNDKNYPGRCIRIFSQVMSAVMREYYDATINDVSISATLCFKKCEITMCKHVGQHGSRVALLT